MLQVLYVSGASRSVSDEDIEDILATSRRNNTRAGITGMLLWVDGVFIQILEGEADTVRALIARIGQDVRHRNFMVLLEQTSDRRLFSEWSMGFKRLDASRPADQTLFEISRAALANRVADHDGGLFLDTIIAFGRDVMPRDDR